ncbi:MAG TPA: hypothetical protein VMK53_11115 [Gemmatimonadales bacterium]|nr:hypothetical protein [Gemmatimonadales bacterium]
MATDDRWSADTMGMGTMSEDATRNAGEIEELLASRQQISEWLHRLGSAGSKVPEAVRERVQSDYESRLAGVVDELRSHSTAISDSLSGLRRELAEQERQQGAEEEALAEAQLRYSVGEFSETDWRKHEERSGTQLEKHGAEIHRLGGEIVRLEDVMAQIAGAPAVADEAEPLIVDSSDAEDGPEAYQLQTDPFITLDDAPVDPRTQSVFDAASALPSDPDPAMEPVPAEPAVPEAPRFTPRGGGGIPPRPRPSASHKAVDDELAFLKSVSQEAPRSTATDTRVAPPQASVGSKTLKCQDCGTLNRPTEWYCERCGAELSAV